jgi:hypothetical protein
VPAASSVASGCEAPSLRTRENVRRYVEPLRKKTVGENLSVPGLTVFVWSLKSSVS